MYGQTDVMCALDADIIVLDNPPQYGTSKYMCKLDSRSTIPLYVTDANGRILASKLSELFYSGVDVCVKHMAENGKQFGKLHPFKQSLVWCDKVSRLQLMWNGQEFKNMLISVDLAVCVLVDKAIVLKVEDWSINDLEINQHYLVCNAPFIATELLRATA